VRLPPSAALLERSRSIVGVQQWVYQAVALGLEVIPRTLASNCGANIMRLMTELRPGALCPLPNVS